MSFALRRVIAGLYLVVGGGMSVVLPLAEARAEAVSATATAHVEEPGDRACVPVHEHSSCTVCRTLRLVGKREAATTFFIDESARTVAQSDDASGAHDSGCRSTEQSRAPPKA